jgi:hypothetical protein
MPKLVCLRGIERGNCFYTTYDDTDTPEEIVKTNAGKVSYEILGFADTDVEAREIILKVQGPYTVEHMAQSMGFANFNLMPDIYKEMAETSLKLVNDQYT